jgi:ATPase family associated with various cellular activities (AAA)
MNVAIKENLVTVSAIDALEVWIYSGLIHFWRSALPKDHAVFQLMEIRIKEILQVAEIPQWQADFPFDLENKELPLIRLIDDFSLTHKDLFILSLCGYLESTHLTNLAVAELQAPDRSSRLSVHLAVSLVEILFIEANNPVRYFDALYFAAHSLVSKQILSLQGEEPLPLKKIGINPWLWAILIGKEPYWPSVTLNKTKSPVSADILTDKIKSELDTLSALLPHYSGIVVRGNPYTGRGVCADFVADCLSLHTVEISVDLWLNQPILKHACYYANWLPVLRLQTMPAQSLQLAESPVLVVVIAPNELTLNEGQLVEFSLDVPDFSYRCALWKKELVSQTEEKESLCHLLAKSARLSAEAIHQIAVSAQQIAIQSQEIMQLNHIAQARARLGADKLRLLAQQIDRQVNQDALVVPVLVKESLDLLLQRAYQRETLWQGLGATLSVTPNPGVRALFVGESGTGKTLAASYIATCLAAPLYRVDLSAVMNKYIGESEKNLAQLLDQAAASDVVLLFDEADSLFGSRGDGQETGERFANMLTNFLLTRIESHPGIVILTTNSRERIDNAFTRRLDLIVEFPLPDFYERLHLWRSHLGERGPGEEVYRNLASYCDLAGGQVRNVVLTAAAVSDNQVITSANIFEGLKVEYRKQGREIPKKLEVLNS